MTTQQEQKLRSPYLYALTWFGLPLLVIILLTWFQIPEKVEKATFSALRASLRPSPHAPASPPTTPTRPALPTRLN